MIEKLLHKAQLLQQAAEALTKAAKLAEEEEKEESCCSSCNTGEGACCSGDAHSHDEDHGGYEVKKAIGVVWKSKNVDY